MKREAAFCRRVCFLLREAGAVTFKVHGSPYQQAGWPDLYVGHREWQGWVELKADDGRPTALQLSTIDRLLDHGVPALVLYEREARDLDGRGLLALLDRRTAEARQGRLA